MFKPFVSAADRFFLLSYNKTTFEQKTCAPGLIFLSKAFLFMRRSGYQWNEGKEGYNQMKE
jgi:hypothetical protein